MIPTQTQTLSFFLLISFGLPLISVSASFSSTDINRKPPTITKLVAKVCKQASSHSFCVNSLYSDSRTPQADDYTLAFISVGLAYANATATRDRISQLLNNSHFHNYHQQPLRRCLRNYNKAISLLGMADNDLNSETFFELADLAAKTAFAATDCEAGFKGISSPPDLGNRNKDLNGLCQICGIVAKLFTGLL